MGQGVGDATRELELEAVGLDVEASEAEPVLEPEVGTILGPLARSSPGRHLHGN